VTQSGMEVTTSLAKRFVQWPC